MPETLRAGAAAAGFVAAVLAGGFLSAATDAADDSGRAHARDPEASETRDSDRGPTLVSGPAAGSKLEAVRVSAPIGPYPEPEFDAAAALGEGSGAFLFLHEITRNVAPMIRAFDDLAIELRWVGFRGYPILLAGDRNSAEEQVVRVSRALRLAYPITVSTDGIEGPGSYALHRRATLTLVLAKDAKVVRSVAYTDTGENDVAKLREMVYALCGPIPEDEDALAKFVAERLPKDGAALRDETVRLVLELRRLRAELRDLRAERRRGGRREMRGPRGGRPPRPGAEAPRQGERPSDAALLLLLRRSIQPDATEDNLDRVFADVEKRAGESADLRRQAVEMFRLMLHLDYGTASAKRRARAFVQKHSPTAGGEAPKPVRGAGDGRRERAGSSRDSSAPNERD